MTTETITRWPRVRRKPVRKRWRGYPSSAAERRKQAKWLKKWKVVGAELVTIWRDHTKTSPKDKSHDVWRLVTEEIGG